MDRAVFLLTCSLGSTATTVGDCISLHSSSDKVNAGTEYVNLGIRYRRYDQREALQLRPLPVIAVAYSKEMDLNFILAKAFDPLGEIYAPSVLNPYSRNWNWCCFISCCKKESSWLLHRG
jgi:hypothetical protein